MHVAAPPYLKSINAKKKATAYILFCFMPQTLCLHVRSVNHLLQW